LLNPYLAYQNASPEGKRRLVKSMCENLIWNGEKVIPNWKNEFKLVAEAKNVELVDFVRVHWNQVMQELQEWQQLQLELATVL
jgi:hypothetical protein